MCLRSKCVAMVRLHLINIVSLQWKNFPCNLNIVHSHSFTWLGYNPILFIVFVFFSLIACVSLPLLLQYNFSVSRSLFLSIFFPFFQSLTFSHFFQLFSLEVHIVLDEKVNKISMCLPYAVVDSIIAG